MSTQRLPAAGELAGYWVITGGRATCRLVLTARPVGRGYRVEGGECLAAVGLARVAVWIPAPDGIALASIEGRTIGFFSAMAGVYQFDRRGDHLKLRRAIPMPKGAEGYRPTDE